MGSRGSDTHTHHSGGIFDREVVIEHELQNLTLTCGKLRERMTQALSPRLELNLRVRRGKAIRGKNPCFPLPASPFPLPAFPLQQHSAQPRLAPLRSGSETDYAEQPGAKARSPVVTRASIQYGEIHGLQNLLGVVAIALTTRHRPAEAIGVRPL